MPNILQDFGDYKQHETNEEEDVHTIFGEISEPTLPLSSTEIEIIGNNNCDTLQGEDPFSTLPLSQAEVHDVSCDKKELCDNDTVAHVSQLVPAPDIITLERNICVQNIIFLPIASENDELKLLSSLNTLGYIEFDNLCTLSSLKEKFICAELPWLHRCIYHFIGRYNCIREYMVHRVYMCSNLIWLCKNLIK